MIAIAYTYTDQNALVTIKCEGDEDVTRRIVNEKVFVPDKLPSAEYEE